MNNEGLLSILLRDKTTGRNIIWGSSGAEMTLALVTGRTKFRLFSRADKTAEQRQVRTRVNAEVFTPLRICKMMNDYADEVWTGVKGAFDGERVLFGNVKRMNGREPWQRYVDSRRLEITCGEAPYLISRYDASIGEPIPVSARTGLLDRKLRVVSENAADMDDWDRWALRAYQATYGYEYQGDNLLIARINALLDYEEHRWARWGVSPSYRQLSTVANVIAWNLWQMDGLTARVPCGIQSDSPVQMELFKAEEDTSFTSPLCKVYDWRRDNSCLFCKVREGERPMKFDFVIGNPPYQDEVVGDNKTYAKPIYDKFMDAAYVISDKVELITPARFLFKNGGTSDAWNEKMLKDPHFKILSYEPDSSKIFPNTDIKGGVVISYRDATKEFEPIVVFTNYAELNSILTKIQKHRDEPFSRIVFSRTSYRLTKLMHDEHPEAAGQLSKGHLYDMSTNIFERLSQLFFDVKPNDDDEYIKILGRFNNNRSYKWIKRKYVNEPKDLGYYKVFVPKANGSGSFGEELSMPLIAEPWLGHAETFMSIGAFETNFEAESVLKYIKTKFARALLGVLKATQDNPPAVWRMIPLQDFTPSSDIEWTQSVADIDKQLYAKYGLSPAEIDFIESHVKEMK